MEYSCYAPVIFFDSLKSFCNLPDAIVRKIIFFKHPICVHLTWSSIQTEPIILVWSGDISKNINSAVEIPHSIAELSGIRNYVDNHPGEIISVKVHSCAIEAIEISLMDCEEYDWQLTSNLAHVAEREILKQHSIVYTNQKMKFYITPTLSVTLLVTSIITNKSSIEHEPREDFNKNQQPNLESNPSKAAELHIPFQNLLSQAVTNILSFFDDKNEMDSNDITSESDPQSVGNNFNINQPNIIVAKLTTRTKVIVIPKDRRKNNSADHSYANHSQNSEDNDNPTESIIDNQRLTNKLYEQQFRYVSTSSAFACPLFVLPHRYRDQNTAFSPLRNQSEAASFSGRRDDSKNILSLFLAAQDSSNNLSNKSDLFLSSDSAQPHQPPHQPPHQLQYAQEEATCFVHPLYFHRIEEILSQSHPPSTYPSNPTTTSFPETSFLVLLEKVSVKKSEVVRPLADSLVLRIIFSTQVRPEFISLPFSARKSLNVSDFDLIRIKLLNEKDIKIIRPDIITFHPIQWKLVNDQDGSNINSNSKKSSDLGIFSDISSISNKYDNTTIDHTKSAAATEGRKDDRFHLALRRYFERQRLFTDRSILSHGMVIPLQLELQLLSDTPLVSDQRRITQREDRRQEQATSAAASAAFTSSSLRALSGNSFSTKLIQVDYQVNLCYDRNLTTPSTTKSNGGKGSDSSALSATDTGLPPFFFVELQTVQDSDRERGTTHQDKLLSYLQDCRMGAQENVAISSTCSLHCQTTRRLLLDTTDSLPSSCLGVGGGGDVVPVGQEKIFSSLLQEVLPMLWPTAALDRLRHGVAPGAGAVLSGGPGSGKSSLLRSMRRLFEDSPQTVAYVETVQCATLRGKSMTEVLQTFTTVFVTARSKPVSLLLLDDIDALCPAASEEPGSELASTQAEMIAKHISDLITSTYSKMMKNHQVAISLYDILNPDDSSSSSSSHTADSPHSLPYRHERIVAQSLHGAVFVVATAQTAALQPCLLSLNGLRRVLHIPALKSIDRIRVLKAALVRLGAEPTSTSLWGKEEEDSIGRATEGFRVGDLLTISKKVLAARITQSSRPTSPSPRSGGEGKSSSISVSASDVLASITDFIPLASVGDSGGSGGGADSPPSDWSTVGGLKGIQKELKNVLRRPLLFRRLYNNCPVKLPRGILLYGPPGCGKTMIAAAAGKECGMACISVRGPQLLNKYVGASERAMRDLFERARSSGRPCLLFFDEFEALAPKRGRDNSGVTDRVVNQLLTFLDGVEDTMGGQAGEGEGQVFVLAATSRPDMVDVALLRPGRIERHLYIGLPNRRQRLDILRLSLRPLCCHHDVSEAVAEMSEDRHSEGLTGADLRGLVNSAFLLAAHTYIDNLTKLQEIGNEESSAAIMQSFGDTAIVTASNLWEALATTRPSISPQDQLFYAEIHGRFRQSSEREGGSSFPAADSGEDVLKQRTALM